MMIINDKWAILVDKKHLNYIPMLYRDEKEYRSPRTGKVEIMPAGYKSIERYYPTIPRAIKAIAYYELKELCSGEQHVNYEEIANRFEKIADNLYQDCLKNLKNK